MTLFSLPNSLPVSWGGLGVSRRKSSVPEEFWMKQNGFQDQIQLLLVQKIYFWTLSNCPLEEMIQGESEHKLEEDIPKFFNSWVGEFCISLALTCFQAILSKPTLFRISCALDLIPEKKCKCGSCICSQDCPATAESSEVLDTNMFCALKTIHLTTTNSCFRQIKARLDLTKNRLI